jgi:hypothetical protein
MFPELKKISALNECYASDLLNKSFLNELQKVVHGLLPVANGVLKNFNKATDVLMDFLQFPVFLNLSVNYLKDICSEKESISPSLQFVDYKKLSTLHDQFSSLKYETKNFNDFTSVNQSIKNALESISSAPFGVSLADVIEWNDNYQVRLFFFKR